MSPIQCSISAYVGTGNPHPEDEGGGDLPEGYEPTVKMKAQARKQYLHPGAGVLYPMPLEVHQVAFHCARLGCHRYHTENLLLAYYGLN